MHGATAVVNPPPHTQRIYAVDTKGLITTTRGDVLPEHKQSVARTDGIPDKNVCV